MNLEYARTGRKDSPVHVVHDWHVSGVYAFTECRRKLVRPLVVIEEPTTWDVCKQCRKWA